MYTCIFQNFIVQKKHSSEMYVWNRELIELEEQKFHILIYVRFALYCDTTEVQSLDISWLENRKCWFCNDINEHTCKSCSQNQVEFNGHTDIYMEFSCLSAPSLLQFVFLLETWFSSGFLCFSQAVRQQTWRGCHCCHQLKQSERSCSVRTLLIWNI